MTTSRRQTKKRSSRLKGAGFRRSSDRGNSNNNRRNGSSSQTSFAPQYHRSLFRFLATCPSGLEDLVAICLSQDHLPGLHIDHIEDGVVLFSSTTDFKRLVALKYINILFVVLAQIDHLGSASEAVGRIGRDAQAISRSAALVTPRERTFRLSVSNEGALSTGGPDTSLLVGRLAEATGLTPSSRHRPDAEFWVMRRRSGLCLFAKRFSRRAGTEKTLQKGELRPEIAHLLCRLSEPERSDVFVDPFAGSGALPLARMTYPFELIYALDADAEKIHLLKQKIKEAKRRRKRLNVIAARADATDLGRFNDGFVSKIVTDPPWGQFDTTIVNLPEFYDRVFREALRILKDNGVLVMLMGNRSLANEITESFASDMTLEARYETLIGGKPAVICKWRRFPCAPGTTDR